MSSYTASPIDRVVYGQPAATVVAEESARLGAERVFLMVSRTLDRETTWVADIRSALGNRYAGQFDGMPSHTPRDAVLRATDQARAAHADLIVTFGGGSITDAGKMVRLALRLDIRDVAGFDPYVVRVHPDGSRTFPVHEGPTIAQIARSEEHTSELQSH